MPKNETVYVVEGFAFYSEAEAEQAKRSAKALNILKKRLI